MIGARRATGAWSRGRHPGGAAALLALVGLAAGCGAGGPVAVSAPPTTSAAAGGPPSPANSAPTTTTPGAAGHVTVDDDQGATFSVSAAAVSPSLIVTVGNGVWSASPGHQFLHDELSVTNPTSTNESLAEFDDPTTGLADGLALVVPQSVAQRQGYGLDCGVEPLLPSGLCPISFGEGLTVDSDSAGSGSELAPGHTAQVAVSYGPVPDSVDPAAVSVWFIRGRPGPSDLSS